MIRITNEGLTTTNAKITTEDGNEIQGVYRVDIRMRIEEVVCAVLDIHVGEVDIEAHPLLGLETLRQSAEHHGYELVKVEEDG